MWCVYWIIKNSNNHNHVGKKEATHKQTNINDAQIEQFATVAEHFRSLTHACTRTLERKKMESEENPKKKSTYTEMNTHRDTETHRHRPNIGK